MWVWNEISDKLNKQNILCVLQATSSDNPALIATSSSFRPHRMHSLHNAAYCDRRSRRVVCLSASLTHSYATQNGWTDRGPVRGGDSWGPKAHCIRWESRCPYGKGVRCGLCQISLASCSGKPTCITGIHTSSSSYIRLFRSWQTQLIQSTSKYRRNRKMVNDQN